MLQKVKKEYQIFAAVILLLVISVGYLVANQKSELSEQMNDSVKASSLNQVVVIDGVKEVSKTGTTTRSIGTSYANQKVTFQSVLGQANDEIIYEITYQNLSSDPYVLRKAELYPDETDLGSITYTIRNVKEYETVIKPKQKLKVLVGAKVNETAPALTSPEKTYEARLLFEKK